MRFVSTLALVSLMLPDVAEGAVVSYSAPASGAEAAVENTIADFDPTLGTLERVQLRLTGTVSDHFHGGFRYSPDGYPGHGDAPTFTGAPYVALDSLAGFHFGTVLISDPVTVPVWVYHDSYSGGYQESIDLAADIHPFFFGANPDGEVKYALTAGTDVLDYSFRTYQMTFGPEFDGTATVTYTYNPVGVPEPASLALMGLGLAGCMAARRRTTNAAASCRRPTGTKRGCGCAGRSAG